MFAVTQFAGKRIAMFGLARSGISCARALALGGAEVFAWDDSEPAVEKARAEGLQVTNLHTVDFKTLAALVLSPGVPLTHPEPHWTVVKARAAATSGANGTPAERSALEGQLSGALGKLLAVAEAYPDLKANTTFLEFQDALRGVEDEIQLARRYYNGAVRNLNTSVESFPQNVIANAFKFTKDEYFELENEADRAVPTVKF